MSMNRAARRWVASGYEDIDEGYNQEHPAETTAVALAVLWMFVAAFMLVPWYVGRALWRRLNR